MHRYMTPRENVLYTCYSRHLIYFFTEMRAWFESNEDAATLDKFLKETKHFTRVHCLKANAKLELLTIIMQYLKTVSKYYQQIFRLWQNTETPADKRIEKFSCIL